LGKRKESRYAICPHRRPTILDISACPLHVITLLGKWEGCQTNLLPCAAGLLLLLLLLPVSLRSRSRVGGVWEESLSPALAVHHRIRLYCPLEICGPLELWPSLLCRRARRKKSRMLLRLRDRP
jgi:hypothetical protein